jgi:hypothetical protein
LLRLERYTFLVRSGGICCCPADDLQTDWSAGLFRILRGTGMIGTIATIRRRKTMFRIAFAAGALVALTVAATGASQAASDDRLLIVNGNTGHVVYDDGRDDLFCVTRRVVVGYTEEGRRIVRRNMHCR